MTAARSLRLLLVAALVAATVALVAPASAATATVSGRILLADGSPALGRVATAAYPPHAFPTTWLDLAADGSLTLEAEQGPTQLYGSFPVPQPSDPGFRIELLSDGFELGAGGRAISVALPPIATVRAHVVDGAGAPVPDAVVTRTSADYGVVGVVSEQGLPVSVGGGPTSAAVSIPADGAGIARVPSLLGSSGLELVAAAGGRESAPTAVAVPTDPTDVTLTLPDPVVTPVDPLEITTSSLPAGRQGNGYSTTFAGTGGRPPYTWSVASGSLPDGLWFSPSGVIGGTPTASTPSSGVPVTVRLADSSSPTVSVARTFSITVDPVEPTVATTTLAAAQVGTAYTQTLQGTGGRTPYSWSVSSGALPAGLSLSGSGVISGTPTVEQAASFRVQLRDGSSPAVLAARDLTIAVATVAVTTVVLPDAVVAKAYSATLTASGGKPGYTWSLVSGSLPAGLTLSSLGKITGTPGANGAATFTVRAQDTSSPVKKAGLRELTLTVGPMTVADPALPRGLAGKLYPATTLRTVGGKGGYGWSVVSGGLPAGLKLSATGTISGTPVGPGTSIFTVRVTDASVPKNVATRELSITVDPMTVSTASLPDGAVRKLYTNQTLKASGGKGTLTWAVASGALPPGMRLSSGGLISGTPTAAGSYTFTVRVSDTSVPKNVATRTLVITVR